MLYFAAKNQAVSLQGEILVSLEKATESKHNTNPTGKGGFGDRPENINRTGLNAHCYKKRWNNLQDWYEMLLEGWPDLKPVEKVDRSLQGMMMLINKVNAIHVTAEESVKNVVGEVQEKKKEVEESLVASPPISRS